MLNSAVFEIRKTDERENRTGGRKIENKSDPSIANSPLKFDNKGRHDSATPTTPPRLASNVVVWGSLCDCHQKQTMYKMSIIMLLVCQGFNYLDFL